jgi:hypothetical protein
MIHKETLSLCPTLTQLQSLVPSAAEGRGHRQWAPLLNAFQEGTSTLNAQTRLPFCAPSENRANATDLQAGSLIVLSNTMIAVLERSSLAHEYRQAGPSPDLSGLSVAEGSDTRKLLAL